MGFRAKLTERQKTAKTLVCVGLDPLEEKMPPGMAHSKLANKFFSWMRRVVSETAEFASMFKPQSAHWEAVPDGQNALKDLIDLIHQDFPDIPVLLDCKRGDIARTQKQYAHAHFGIQHADGMNFSPYMGKDCMAALVDPKYPGKALVGLCYTSNPDAREIQDIIVRPGDGRVISELRLWEFIAERTLQWADELGVIEDAGLVMAAAYGVLNPEDPKGPKKIYSRHLTRCRQLVDDKLWFLIPGIGTQGGFIEETVFSALRGPGTIAINSSSDIIFAEKPGEKAKQLRDAINQHVNW